MGIVRNSDDVDGVRSRQPPFLLQMGAAAALGMDVARLVRPPNFAADSQDLIERQRPAGVMGEKRHAGSMVNDQSRREGLAD